MKSTLVKITLTSLIFTLFFIPHLASAETKTFIKEYTYQASELDSKASSRTIALEQVKRLLLEELGSYLESKTEVKNFKLSKDKITALSAGIVQTQIIAEKWDGKNYWLKALIKADPENIAKSIDILRKDQRKTEDQEENTSTDDLPLVNHIPSEFQKSLEIHSSKASSWVWRPGKKVICIVEVIKAVNGMAFLNMATIMLSKNTYDTLNSRNSREYSGRVFFTQLELTGYDNAGNINYKQLETNFDLAELPIYEKIPLIGTFWKGSNENTVFGNSEITLELIRLGLFSKKNGETKSYICPIGTEFKLNNFIFFKVSFKLNRIGNTNEFAPSLVSIEPMIEINE